MILRLILYNMPSISYHIANSVESWLGERLYKKKQGKSKGFDSCDWVRLDDFFSCVTLQFDVWPWKTTGYLFYATYSFVHHFVAIGVFKLELKSGNAQFGSNSTIFRGVWPWNLTDEFENNRAPLQCYFKCCASFRNHWWF